MPTDTAGTTVSKRSNRGYQNSIFMKAEYLVTPKEGCHEHQYRFRYWFR